MILFDFQFFFIFINNFIFLIYWKSFCYECAGDLISFTVDQKYKIINENVKKLKICKLNQNHGCGSLKPLFYETLCTQKLNFAKNGYWAVTLGLCYNIIHTWFCLNTNFLNLMHPNMHTSPRVSLPYPKAICLYHSLLLILSNTNNRTINGVKWGGLTDP